MTFQMNEAHSPVLLPKIQKLVRDETSRLEREQITPWIMGFATGNFKTEDFHKRKITYGGISFSGSPQHVFWGRYIEPFLEDFTSRTIEQVVEECLNNNLALEIELHTLEQHLKGMFAATFNRMVRAEQLMLGKGYPDSVPPRNVAGQINGMNRFLEQHVAMEIAKYKSRMAANQGVKMDDEFKELNEPQHKNRIARWEEIGVDAIKADLNSGGTRYVGTFAKQALAWKWVRLKEQGKPKEAAAIKEAATVVSGSIVEILTKHESEKIEFKSTYQWDIKLSQKSDEVRKATMKTVAAFLNTEGGTLVLGISDDSQVLGLEADLKLVKGNSNDALERAFRDAFDASIGIEFAVGCKVRFEEAEKGKYVCIIDVSPSAKPVFLNRGGGAEEFYIRRGNSSKSLSPREQHEYIKTRF